MTPTQIYSRYGLPQNLQEHMLRVTALATIILDHWQGPPVDKPAIIQACLFHDIAKPITFDMDKQTQFVKSATELEALRQLQTSLISRYGHNERTASIKIMREIGCSPTAITLMNDFEWIYLPRLLKSLAFDSLIAIYCDMRIGPHGILSMSSRISNLQTRTHIDGLDIIIQSGKKLEQRMCDNLDLDPNFITDTDINKIITLLKNEPLNS